MPLKHVVWSMLPIFSISDSTGSEKGPSAGQAGNWLLGAPADHERLPYTVGADLALSLCKTFVPSGALPQHQCFPADPVYTWTSPPRNSPVPHFPLGEPHVVQLSIRSKAMVILGALHPPDQSRVPLYVKRHVNSCIFNRITPTLGICPQGNETTYNHRSNKRKQVSNAESTQRPVQEN